MTKIRVLIADDHPVLLEALRDLLTKEPDLDVVGVARDGAEVVKLAGEKTPNVILMDIVMPQLDGIEATREIKKISPACAVLPLTAFDDERYILGLLEAGAAGYLLKSASAAEIVEAVRAVHAGESVMHPTATARLLARALRHPSEEPRPKTEIPLTDREMEILRLAAKGMGNKEIADKLSLTVPTVKAHLVNIFNKIGVGSRTEAVLQALRHGWVKLENVAAEV